MLLFDGVAEIAETTHVYNGCSGEEKSSRRKSTRKRKMTEKYEIYSQRLVDVEGNSERDGGNEETKVSSMMKRLSLDETHSEDIAKEELGHASTNCDRKPETEADKSTPCIDEGPVRDGINSIPVSDDIQDPIVVNVGTPVVSATHSISSEVCPRDFCDSEEKIMLHENQDANQTNIEDVVDVVEDVNLLLDDIDRLLQEHPHDMNDHPMTKKDPDCEKEKKEKEKSMSVISHLEEVAKKNDERKERECWKKEEEKMLKRIEELENDVATYKESKRVLEQQCKVKESMSDRIKELEKEIAKYEEKVKS